MSGENQEAKAPTQPVEKSYYERVADMLIDKIEQGTAPWQKPWAAGQDLYPQNPTTDKHYHGINQMILMAQGRDDPRWLTYKQAQSIGAQVNKGEKGTPIVFYDFTEKVAKLDENGKPVLNEKGEEVKETVMTTRPRAIWSTVFNAEQIAGMPPLEQKAKAWNEIEAAEKIIKETGANIAHKPIDNAFYNPVKDQITLPKESQFQNAVSYYQTALHELWHWTGHKSRLDRDLSARFGTKEYAREELRAEIASVMTGAKIGIGSTPREENAAYVKNWVEILRNDPKEIYRAAADAEKAAQYITKSLNLEVEKQPAQNIEKSPIDKSPNSFVSAKNSIVSVRAELHKIVDDMQKGDFSKLPTSADLIKKASELSKSGSEVKKDVKRMVEGFTKELKQIKLSPQTDIQNRVEINKQIRIVDKHFDLGLGR
jgi:antirestriction protein ArdC